VTSAGAKRVAYASPFVPPEWIAAHGLEPIRIWPSTDTGAARAGVCPYAWGWVQAVVQQSGWAGVVVTATCDQMRRSADALALASGHAVCLLHIPCRAESPSSADYFGTELQRLGRTLVDWGGQAPTQDRLRRIMETYNQRRNTLRALRGQVCASDFCRAAQGRQTITAPQQTVNREGACPLGLVGSPLTWDALSMLDAIEAAGARLVFDGTENGEGGLCAPFDRDRLDEAPFAELIQAYFNSILHIGRRPNTDFFTWLQRQLTEERIAGLIVHRHPWCDLWHAELPRLRARSGLPVLDLETTGQEPGQQMRQVTRIQAFMETLS